MKSIIIFKEFFHPICIAPNVVTPNECHPNGKCRQTKTSTASCNLKYRLFEVYVLLKLLYERFQMYKNTEPYKCYFKNFETSKHFNSSTIPFMDWGAFEETSNSESFQTTASHPYCLKNGSFIVPMMILHKIFSWIQPFSVLLQRMRNGNLDGNEINQNHCQIYNAMMLLALVNALYKQTLCYGYKNGLTLKNCTKSIWSSCIWRKLQYIDFILTDVIIPFQIKNLPYFIIIGDYRIRFSWLMDPWNSQPVCDHIIIFQS